MTVQMMIEEPENDKAYEYRNLYISEDLLQGFYIPEDEEALEPIYNILYPQLGVISIKATKEVRKILERKFVD